MSVTKVVFLFVATSALGFSQTYLGENFDELSAPSGCLRNNTVPPAAGAAIPALKLPGMTISGGQALSYSNSYQTGTYNNIYATMSTCAGEQPAITITFDGPVSGLNMVIGNNWAPGESLSVVDDAGGSQNVGVGEFNNGQTLFFTNRNIHTVTLSLSSPAWTPSSPAGFYIDNITCYINEPLYFIDPVPNLMSGTGVITDPQSLATLGTLIRGVAADGQARVLLSAPTHHVGDVVTFSVVSNLPTDGAVGPINGSSGGGQAAVRAASQDSSNGPMAFALYYPPTNFSRGAQDDQLANRTVSIQATFSAANTAAVTRSLTILRPPVVLVHDLWGDPSDWDTFTTLVNDSRFFIRRASYNGVLGAQISASIPTFQSASIGRARENSLGMAYNAPVLLNQIAQVVNEFRSINNVAAAQADVVVHGMGGTIARALVQLANYEAPESFDQGNVNKLITIGTPHLGTPLATTLLQTQNSCFREVLAGAGHFSFSTATVNNNTVSGGIGDIQGNGFGGGLSPALTQIQQRGNDTVPTALIAGIATTSNFNGLNNSTGVAQFVRQFCSGTPLAASLTSSGWTGVFVDLSDAMVPWFSQLAGQLFGPASSFNGIVHSQGFEQLGFNPPGELDPTTPVAAEVITLLNTQPRGAAFQSLP
jgi:pimeloyl-ACP methyl ester carboxylesterase